MPNIPDATSATAPSPSPDAPVETATPAAAPKTEPELSPAACAARLAESFPALFGTDGPIKPLKLRIQADIQQRMPGVFSRRVLGIFFSRYTTSNAYLKALGQAPHRFDLDGQAAGDISDEHRHLAAEELARRREVHLARVASARGAQRVQDTAARQAHAADELARRDRAGLLRSFESSTLTKANFCALKGLAESALDALLAQARQERAEPAAPPLREKPAPRSDGPRRPGSHGHASRLAPRKAQR